MDYFNFSWIITSTVIYSTVAIFFPAKLQDTLNPQQSKPCANRGIISHFQHYNRGYVFIHLLSKILENILCGIKYVAMNSYDF